MLGISPGNGIEPASLTESNGASIWLYLWAKGNGKVGTVMLEQYQK